VRKDLGKGKNKGKSADRTGRTGDESSQHTEPRSDSPEIGVSLLASSPKVAAKMAASPVLEEPLSPSKASTVVVKPRAAAPTKQRGPKPKAQVLSSESQSVLQHDPYQLEARPPSPVKSTQPIASLPLDGAGVEYRAKYSQIEKNVEGNEVVYDLSTAPSQLVRVPSELDQPADEEEEPPKEVDEGSFKEPLPRKQSAVVRPSQPEDDAFSASYTVQTPAEISSVAEEREVLFLSAEEEDVEGRKRAPPAKSVNANQWLRGKIDGHAVRYAEPVSAAKLFQGFQFIVTGCKVMNEMDPPARHVSYYVLVGDKKQKTVLSDWIHTAVTTRGGKELWYALPGLGGGNPLLQQQQRLGPSIAPVPGTPFECNVICLSEKPHRTCKWFMAVEYSGLVDAFAVWRSAIASSSDALCCALATILFTFRSFSRWLQMSLWSR
jgi:hypothetical protein